MHSFFCKFLQKWKWWDSICEQIYLNQNLKEFFLSLSQISDSVNWGFFEIYFLFCFELNWSVEKQFKTLMLFFYNSLNSVGLIKSFGENYSNVLSDRVTADDIFTIPDDRKNLLFKLWHLQKNLPAFSSPLLIMSRLAVSMVSNDYMWYCTSLQKFIMWKITQTQEKLVINPNK